MAYVWHGGLRSVEQATSLEQAGFAIRSQIIWNKGRLVISRGDANVLEHRHVRDLARHLRAGDLIVVNNTRVIPARFEGRRKINSTFPPIEPLSC